MVILTQGVEQFVFAATWTALYGKMFPKSKLNSIMNGAIHVIVASILTVICLSKNIRYLMPIAVIFSSLFNATTSKRKNSIVVVETLFSYMIAKLLWFICLFPAFMLVNAFGAIHHAMVEAACICVLDIALCLLVYTRISADRGELIVTKYSTIIVSAAGVCFTAAYAITAIPYIEHRREFHIFALLVIMSLMIIVVAWTLSDTQRRKEAEEQKGHIDTLVRSAHKYKEIIPAVERELKEMQRKINADSDHDWASELGVALEEITVLRKSSEQVSARELRAIPNFPSTGLTLLDSQLQMEQETAAQSGVVFDCAVVSSAAALIEKGILTQFQLQQMLGDLFRNALKAVQDAREEGGRILLILGETKDGYQIKMCDTGIPFPKEILEHLGERGITTGGTGHGLADICDLLSTCRASLKIEGYTSGNGGFTKAVTICFDGKAERRI